MSVRIKPVDQPQTSSTNNVDSLMDFNLSSLAGNLTPAQQEILEKNLLESAFKKLVSEEKIAEPDVQAILTKINSRDLVGAHQLLQDKVPNLKVKFLAYVAQMKEDYIWILLHLMKLRSDPKYSPALLAAAKKRDWPTLAHLCQAK